ncbi:MAG: sporulation protein YunB [Bacillota bacterium]|nr:sporulation protein YunB [Bacillota bacterium]
MEIRSRHPVRVLMPRRRMSRASRFFLRFFIILFIILVGLIYFVEFKLHPILKEVATSRASTLAISLISKAVNEKLSEENIKYSDVVKFEKDEKGNITALTTDTVKMNLLQAELSDCVIKKLQLDDIKVSVPIGNIINGELLTGRGPRIYFKLIPVSNVTTKISNLFTSAGINQTRLQIMLDVNVNMSVLLPISSTSTDVKTSICIAETVVVGAVPNSYTQVDEFDRDTVDQLNDYGESTKGDDVKVPKTDTSKSSASK